MKISLFCNAGMSTSMLVAKMRKLAGDKHQIEAYSMAQLGDKVKETDVVLLGPQVKFMLGEAKKEADKYGIPVDVISMQDYGMMNAEAVIKQAEKLGGYSD